MRLSKGSEPERIWEVEGIKKDGRCSNQRPEWSEETGTEGSRLVTSERAGAPGKNKKKKKNGVLEKTRSRSAVRDTQSLSRQQPAANEV